MDAEGCHLYIEIRKKNVIGIKRMMLRNSINITKNGMKVFTSKNGDENYERNGMRIFIHKNWDENF